MIVDTEDLARLLYDASLCAKKVPLSKILPLIHIAFSGHPAVDEPDQYRWFRIKRFPVSDFELTLEDLLEEAGEHPSDDEYRHDKIAQILRAGGPEFPALATATGVLVDGYHRIAAHDTLKIGYIPVLVAVRKPGPLEQDWDEQWNHNFPTRR